VLITRFSYRGKGVFGGIDGPTFVQSEDPLSPERLELRFKLFEFTCLPSVLGQTQQNFLWIVLVDPQLPQRYYERLSSLVSGRDRTFIHPFDRRFSLAELEWLGSHIPSEGRVITTNLDDDDCIPRQFVQAMQQHVESLEPRSAPPPIGIIGSKSGLEWDLVPAVNAPLGWKAPWHRGNWVLSVGLSLYCRVPEFALCVLGLRHRWADTYLDFKKPPVNANAAWFRESVVRAAHTYGIDLARWDAADLFHDISRGVGAVILTNHHGNDQATRLLEPKPGRVGISSAEAFPDFAIDWVKARQFAEWLQQRH